MAFGNAPRCGSLAETTDPINGQSSRCCRRYSNYNHPHHHHYHYYYYNNYHSRYYNHYFYYFNHDFILISI